MKIPAKTKRLLQRECNQCGSCCCDPLIEVTHHDLKRLVKHTGITADRLVKLYGIADLESDDDHDWIRLSYGNRLIGLAKQRNGRCIFLSDENNCQAYPARPMSCRLFPVYVTYEEDESDLDFELSDLIKDKFINCQGTYGKGRPYKEFKELARQAQKEYDSFCKKNDKWNDKEKRGGKNDYLNFLGFKTG